MLAACVSVVAAAPGNALAASRARANADGAGILVGRSLGSFTDTLTPNGYGEIDDDVAQVSSSDVYQRHVTSRDLVGRILAENETVGTDPTVSRQYQYFGDGELAEVDDGNGSALEQFTYDANGNRTSATYTNLPGAPPSVASADVHVDQLDELTQYGDLDLSYDKDGRVKTITDSSDNTETDYDYDQMGILRRVTKKTGGVTQETIEYIVDAEGRRIGRLADTGSGFVLTDTWLYNGKRRPVVWVHDPDGTPVRTRFVYGRNVMTPAYMVKNGTTYVFATNSVGSPRALVNVSDGSIKQQIDYDAFGYQLSNSAPTFQPFGFAGGLVDPDTGLVGSIIDCDNQTLGESIPIAGTGMTLNYSSYMAPGNKSKYRITVPLSGASVPSDCQSIHADVSVAGRRWRTEVSCEANQKFTVNWDGRDAWGRRLEGAQSATVSVGYQYAGVSYAASTTFGAPGTYVFQNVSVDRASRTVIFWTTREVSVGGLSNTPANSLGGWTLSPFARLDPVSNTVYYGDGSERRFGLGPLPERGKDQVWGPGVENVRAVVAVSPIDGTLYVGSNDAIYTVPAGGGAPTLFAGSDGVSENSGCDGDGSNPLLARFVIASLAFDRYGNLYVGDDHTIRRISSTGTVSTVMGIDSQCPDIPPEDQVDVAGPDLQIVNDKLFVHNNSVTPDQVSIWTTSSKGEAWTQPQTIGLNVSATGMAVDDDEAIYFTSDDDTLRSYRNGTLTILAGTSQTPASDSDPATFGDGGAPEGALLYGPGAVAIGPDHAIYFADDSGLVLRRIGNGRITRVAGRYGQPDLGYVESIAFGPDGAMYLGSFGDAGTVRLRPAVLRIRDPLSSGAEAQVPRENGSVVDLFDVSGRHTETDNGITGALVDSFGYTSGGRPASVTDPYGNTTTITYAPDGASATIQAPFGQKTTLTFDATTGYLTSIDDPKGETTTLCYDPAHTAPGKACKSSSTGLLTGLIDPKKYEHDFQYSATGLLEQDSFPSPAPGGGQTSKGLARAAVSGASDWTENADYQVGVTSPTGLLTTYAHESSAARPAI